MIDDRLYYVYNWLGKAQQKIAAIQPIKRGKHTLRKLEILRREENNSPIGPARLFMDGQEVNSHEIKIQLGFFVSKKL